MGTSAAYRTRGNGAVLAVLLGVALLLCHGIFGGLHLLSSGAASEPTEFAAKGFGEAFVGVHASHGDPHGDPHDPASTGADDAQGGAARAGAMEYAAILVAVVGAVLWFALLVAPRVRLRLPVAMGAGFVPVGYAPVFARGPDPRVLFQVFRL